MKYNFITNSKKIWLLLAALSLQLFLFVGNETQGISGAPVLPQSEWVDRTKEHRPPTTTDLTCLTNTSNATLAITTWPPPFTLHTIISYHQLTKVRLDTNKKQVLSFSPSVFFLMQKSSCNSEDDSPFLFYS